MRTTLLKPLKINQRSGSLKIRRVPLNKFIVGFLRELQLEEYDPNFYIFGSPYVKGNRGSAGKGMTGAKHPDYFKPSGTRIKRDTVTKFGYTK